MLQLALLAKRENAKLTMILNQKEENQTKLTKVKQERKATWKTTGKLPTSHRSQTKLPKIQMLPRVQI